MQNKFSLILTILLALLPHLAHSTTFEIGKNAALRPYDGDSVNIKTRLAHIDTPEIKGECEAEIDLAIQARDYTRKFMKAHPKYSVTVTRVGRYGRPLVEIRSNGRYLNQELVDNGLARTWTGRRESWCD